MTPEQLSVLERNLKVNGYDRQVDKLIEEMGELQTALMKYRYAEGLGIDIISELVDVKITLHQVIKAFENDEAIENMTDYKIKRLEERLNNEISKGQ